MPTVRSLADIAGTPHANAFPTEEPRTIRLTLDAGERVEPHRHPDREIVCYLVAGSLDLRLDGEANRVTAGDVARFDGDQAISPAAVEDCTALLVLAEKSDSDPAG